MKSQETVKLLHNEIDCEEILSYINFNVPQVKTRSIQFFRCKVAKSKSQVHVMCTE